MHTLCRGLVGLALSGLFCGPLAADVVPTRYAENAEAKSAVASARTSSGVDAQLAQARAQRLTSDEAAFFAADARRTQVVGQEMWAGQSDNMWWEWIGGIGMLALTGVGIYFFAVANDD
jgi:hypothetical protein